jgi:predicted CXXCH cytochrome family protein
MRAVGTRSPKTGAALALALACAGPRVYEPVPAAEAALVANPHRFRQASLCQACHVDGRAALAAEPVPLCRSCHVQAHGNHPVLVRPKRPPPPEVPLWRGQVTCGSCHDPHGIGTASRHGLRLASAGKDALCLACHPR